MQSKLASQFRFLYPSNCNDGTNCVPGETFVRVWFSKPEIESKLWFNDGEMQRAVTLCNLRRRLPMCQMQNDIKIQTSSTLRYFNTGHLFSKSSLSRLDYFGTSHDISDSLLPVSGLLWYLLFRWTRKLCRNDSASAARDGLEAENREADTLQASVGWTQDPGPRSSVRGGIIILLLLYVNAQGHTGMAECI